MALRGCIPNTDTWPEVGCDRPRMMSIVEVLPAPLGQDRDDLAGRDTQVDALYRTHVPEVLVDSGQVHGHRYGSATGPDPGFSSRYRHGPSLTPARRTLAKPPVMTRPCCAVSDGQAARWPRIHRCWGRT